MKVWMSRGLHRTHDFEDSILLILMCWLFLFPPNNVKSKVPEENACMWHGLVRL